MSNQTSNFRNAYDGEEMKCRKCGKWATAEWVDIGVGFQQVTPYKCECGWQQGDILEPVDAINLRTLKLAKR